MITIQTQPNTFGISYARSPIVYRYINCLPSCNYQFNLYITNQSISNLTDVYSYVVRVPDLNNGITIDASSMIQNYIRNQIDLSKENIVYVLATLLEYSGTTFTDTVVSNVSKISLGYNNQVGSYGVFNYNEAYYESTDTDYLLNSIQEDVSYYIPNFGYSKFSLSWKKATGKGDGYRILYTGVYGTDTIYQAFSPITNSSSEVETIYCGYWDLENNWGVTDVNITKQITVQILQSSTVLHTYTLKPISCNNNDLVNLKFLNKYGVWEHCFFYGRIDTQFDMTSEVYKFNNVDYTAMEYNPQLGSYHKYFSQGKYKMTLNSGWVDEQQNEKLTQLLLSEYVVIDTNVGDVIPVIITDKTITFQTKKWQKLINYKISLDVAYNEINDIT